MGLGPIHLVLDTNIVLDLLVFDDATTGALKSHLEQGRVRWLATQAMRDELQHVLAYEHIATRLLARGLHAAGVLQAYDRHAVLVDTPASCLLRCSDADDQKFIDLAVAHKCLLLSKDAAVLALKKRLAALEVIASAVMPGA